MDEKDKDETAPPLRHPAINQALKWFECDHLKPELKMVAGAFKQLAYDLANYAPQSMETTHALRKLIEAKDCAVRAAVEEMKEEVTRK